MNYESFYRDIEPIAKRAENRGEQAFERAILQYSKALFLFWLGGEKNARLNTIGDQMLALTLAGSAIDAGHIATLKSQSWLDNPRFNKHFYSKLREMISEAEDCTKNACRAYASGNVPGAVEQIGDALGILYCSIYSQNAMRVTIENFATQQNTD